jgi:hypothetical protein
MFLFNKKNPNPSKIEYKPKLEPFMSSHFKPSVNIMNTPKIGNINNTMWTRIEFEKSREDAHAIISFPYKGKGTLVSSIVKDDKKKNNENQLILFCKNLSKWLSKQIRSTGFLNWFHPWIVIRHSHFYRDN